MGQKATHNDNDDVKDDSIGEDYTTDGDTDDSIYDDDDYVINEKGKKLILVSMMITKMMVLL